jgi:hypothetical protein
MVWLRIQYHDTMKICVSRFVIFIYIILLSLNLLSVVSAYLIPLRPISLPALTLFCTPLVLEVKLI